MRVSRSVVCRVQLSTIRAALLKAPGPLADTQGLKPRVQRMFFTHHRRRWAIMTMCTGEASVGYLQGADPVTRQGV